MCSHQLGENGVVLAVETKSGTKKVTMNWSDLEDNFTASIDGMPVRQMPLYEQATDEGKPSFYDSLSLSHFT